MKLDLSGFGNGNPALEYLSKRISDDNYRGDVSSQHNRWNFEDLIFVLDKLHAYQKSHPALPIRTTDKSKRPQNTTAEMEFAKFCEEVVAGIGKGSQDAMRKNWFVDWHRAGWIERLNSEMQITSPYERSAIKYVRISDEGLKLVSASKLELRDKYFVFSKGVDKLYLGTISVLIDLLRNNDLKHIDVHEFTFFVTGVSTSGPFNIQISEAVQLINSWRQLTPLQKRSIDKYLAKTMVKTSNAKDKTEQRDFHNWINKTQQSFHILKQTIYFEEVKHLNFSHFNRLYFLGSEAIPESEYDKRDSRRLNRSLQQKHNYFANHAVSKTPGFELHHIVALAWAESEYEFKLLDNWLNMIYIDGYSHAQITQNRNLNVVLSQESDLSLNLTDYEGKCVSVKKPISALFSGSNVEKMLEYNLKLLSKKSGIN